MPRLPTLTRWALIFGAWTLIGVLVIAGAAAHRAAGHARPHTPAEVLAILESMWLWALFTPAMFWLAHRWPIERRRWAVGVAMHFGFALAFHVADVVVDEALVVIGLMPDEGFIDRLAGDLFINVYSYLAVVGLGHALTYHGLYQERRAREAELAAALAESQLHALELQLRPHFLFNALNTVSAQIRTGAGAAAVRTVSQLGDLLRALLEDGEHEVTVRDEIALVERYLGIEATRFGGRLTVAIHVDPDAADALLPRLILQPLAENAIRHGCEQVPGPARVDIDVAVVVDGGGDTLRVTVRDSGAGPALGRDGIGLGNARERLQHLYGDSHRLALEPGDGGGTRVVLEVPLHLVPLEP